ncbi:MAG: hypothetical protein BZY88_03885 [SAR202 cluster bacterium Io17-Chloro-G9]|nr:MAG: hypothetical protein BZY88_03885 [SAR202 cluster bacterium Io17-Chloro-G9]
MTGTYFRRLVRTGFLLFFLAVLVTASGNGDHRPIALDSLVAPHRYNVVSWELSHFPDKWVHKLGDVFSGINPLAKGPPDAAQRRAQVREFFNLGRELQNLELQITAENSGLGRIAPEVAIQIRRIEKQREAMREDVEETVESEMGAVLNLEGFSSWPGLIFPPVDTHFSNPPGVLVLSPRDRIFRLKTIVLRPELTNQEKERLEDMVLGEEDLSALVVEISGIATFPSIVSERGDLRRALDAVAHEWLHHWFFFKPLGQGFWDSPQMTTLNETAATIGGMEMGALAHAAITGEPAVRKLVPPRDPFGASRSFDFDGAIRETRLRTEELLAQGEIPEAEDYMEKRRRLLVDQGFRIRKINQAFFAFRQSYATDPGSISPIDAQLRELRQRSDSLEDFLKTVAGFGSYSEFLEHLASDL